MTQTTSVYVRPMSTLASEVNYEIIQRRDSDGRILPHQLGKGRFAKVYKCMQRSGGRNVREVAIKVLHEHVDYGAERLFSQEINLLRSLVDGVSVNTVNLIDIIHLEPLVMCGGCGGLYNPKCPECGDHLLHRKALTATDSAMHQQSHPALHCSKCGYELSANEIHRFEKRLYSAKAKNCCPNVAEGSIINFVDRDAIVMELLESPGDESKNAILRYNDQRRRSVAELCAQYGLRAPATKHLSSLLGKLRSAMFPNHPEVILAKLVLLEKVSLMVQLAEAIAWLHTEKKIVHKDLAPDNILLRTVGDTTGEGRWRGQKLPFSAKIHEMANSRDYEIKVIDFGLADKDELSRSWYEEEDVKAVGIKRPYISSEAQNRKEPASGLSFAMEPVPHIRLPASLVNTELSVLPSDIISDTGDVGHMYDMEIVRVEEVPRGSGNYIAHIRGTPPPGAINRQFQLVRRLGEPHDIYALGGLFYYILTGSDRAVDRLKAFVDLLQMTPCKLTASAVKSRNRAFYDELCRAIPEPFWRDDFMLLSLRAMIRGQTQSYAMNRIERGPEAAQKLLAEVYRIYHGVQQEVLAAGRTQRLQFLLLIVMVIAFISIAIPSIVQLWHGWVSK